MSIITPHREMHNCTSKSSLKMTILMYNYSVQMAEKDKEIKE